MGFAALLVGCGGRVIDDSGSDDLAAAFGGRNAGKGGSGNTSRPGDSSKPLPTEQLGDCVPGFLRAEHPEKPCRWLTESGMCFDETTAACACICPTGRVSVCAHGFESGPNDAKPIFCD